MPIALEMSGVMPLFIALAAPAPKPLLPMRRPLVPGRRVQNRLVAPAPVHRPLHRVVDRENPLLSPASKVAAPIVRNRLARSTFSGKDSEATGYLGYGPFRNIEPLSTPGSAALPDPDLSSDTDIVKASYSSGSSGPSSSDCSPLGCPTEPAFEWKTQDCPMSKTTRLKTTVPPPLRRIA